MGLTRGLARQALTLAIIYGVSLVFLWPAALACLLKVFAESLGWPVGHTLVILVTCVALCWSYDGSERRTGRACNALNKIWPVSHGYFPVSLTVWDGRTFSSRPSSHHLAVLPDTYILALHPHGPFPLSASLLMPQLAVFGAALGDCFARLRFAAASAVFWLPVVRDMYLALGCVEASRKTLTHVLMHGYSVAILPGGEHEQLLVCADDSPFEDIVAPRDGLFRLAIETGSPIVPAFSFGERRSYTSLDFLLSWRLWLVERHRIGIPCAYGRHWWAPFVPKPTPVRLVVGKALQLPRVGAADNGEPDLDAAVADLRARYLTAVEGIFEAHKGSDEVARHKTLRWVQRPTSSTKEK